MGSYIFYDAEAVKFREALHASVSECTEAPFVLFVAEKENWKVEEAKTVASLLPHTLYIEDEGKGIITMRFIRKET